MRLIPKLKKIDQIRIVHCENSVITKKVISADDSDNTFKEKTGTSGAVFEIAIAAFIAAVFIFICFAR